MGTLALRDTSTLQLLFYDSQNMHGGRKCVNGILMWKGGIFQGPTPRQKNYRQLMNAGITLSL